jgi:hypothetical protein
MAKVETVKVKADNRGGFIVINKVDFTDKHTFYVDKKSAKEGPKVKRTTSV